MSWSKKILAYLLVFTMTLSLVPVTAQAEGADVYTMMGTLETWEYLSVPLNASVTLTAMEDASPDYKYQWYGKVYGDDEYTIIMEATGVDYTIDKISTKMEYYCEVLDENGNALGQSYFEISIDNSLKGYVAGTEDGSVDMQVSKGGSITMEVDASVDVGNVSYKWYQWVPKDGEEEQEDLLLDSTAESCTVNDINEYTEYYCDVSDDYGNWERVWFYVSVASGLYAYANVKEESNYKNIKVAQSETATLTVYAGVDEGMGNVSYEWYKDDELLEGKAESTCETDAITTRTTYSCKVSDDYGSYEWVNFYVSVDSGLKAYVADSKYEETEAHVEVPVGQAKTLAVAASVTDGSTISYAWYDEDPSDYEEDDENYPDELGSESAYTTDGVNEKKTYYCKVSDAYGGSITICFYVSVASGLNAYVKDDPNQDTEAYVLVTQGEAVTLEVTATANEGEQIYYKWYKSSDTTEDVELASTTASCETEKITRNQTYYCEVSDAYGETKNVWFYVSVDSKLTVDAVGDDYVTVPLNETTTLEVEATAAEGVALTYQWYYWDSDIDEYELIEGATGTSYTTKAITTSEEYRCEVRDVYGNEESVAFTISVANNFKVEPVGSTSVYVSEGGSATLAVNATANSALTYQWHQSGPEGWFEIENATESTYTTGAITNSTIFVCEVKDSYGNEGTISFRVSVDNGLTATAVGETDLTVDLNDSVTLRVNATATSGNLTYEWLKNDAWILGAEDATYTVDNITEYAEYACVVRDTYDNTQYIRFYIRVNKDTGLTVVADGDATVEVESGTRATLKVIANTTAETELTYLWHQYDSEEQEWIIYDEGRNSSKTPVIKADSQFKCVVRDQYGNEKEVLFTVKPATSQGSGDSPEGGNGSSSEGGTGGSTSEGGSDGTTGGTTGGTDGSTSGDGSNKNDQTSTGDDTQKEENKLVTKIKVTGVSKKVAAGKKLTLKAEVTPADATNKNVVWSSSNKKYATVNAKGVVTTKKAGAGKTVTITAEAQDGSGIKATYKITIMKHVVKSVKISAKTKQVKAGRKLTLKAVVKTTGKKVNKTLKWSSSNTKYATVNAKGVVTAKKAGKGKTVKITAMATDGSGKKATITIKIK